MSLKIDEIYGNKVRIRVCGLCWEEERLLMVSHRLGSKGLWAPPGGGLEFGESMELALKREFLEETGLHIIPKKFLFVCEFLKAPLHAIELFFEVVKVSGILKSGVDPEIQLIENVQFLTQKDIDNIPDESLHGIFRKVKNMKDLSHLNGLYSI